MLAVEWRMPDNRKRLNDRQLAVLAWIGAGCPDDVMTDTTYKTTAAALRSRRLVTISRRRGQWTAALTDDGTHYLSHGAYPPPDRPPRTHRQRSTPAPARATTQPPRELHPEPAPASSRQSPVARKPGPAQRLVDDVQAAGGVLVVQRPTWVDGRASEVDYGTLAQAANRYRKVPPGTRLITRVLPWPDMEVRLVPDETDSHATPPPVPVPDRVTVYHPAVAAFRDHAARHEISPAHLPRACRLLHALAVEAQRRGHTVALAPDPPGRYPSSAWSSTVDGHLTISVAGRTYPLRIREDGLPARGGFNRTNPRGIPYPTSGGNGRLQLAIVPSSSGHGYVGRWADGTRERLEDKLPAVLAEIERRAAADHLSFQELHRPEREAEDRRRAALKQARAAYVEGERARHFLDQVQRWQLVPQAGAFLGALRAEVTSRAADGRDVTAAQQWLVWAERYVTELDPLRGELGMPPVAEPTSEQLQPFLPADAEPQPTTLGP